MKKTTPSSDMHSEYSSRFLCESGSWLDTGPPCSGNALEPAEPLQSTGQASQHEGHTEGAEDSHLARRREINRRSQRRYKQKKKAQLQEAQAALARKDTEMKQLQSRSRYYFPNVSASKSQQSSTNNPSFVNVPWQAPSALNHDLMDRLLKVPWLSESLHAYLLSAGQSDDLQMVAVLTPQQLALCSRGYVKQAAECLLITGQETAGCSAGAQLQRVMDEYCCLHNVKGLLDPRGHRTHMSIAQQLEDCSSSSDSQPDWTAIGLLLGLSAEQKSALFAARRRYMTDLACISRKRHALLQQLQIESGLLGATNQEAAHQFLSADDIVQQLQSCSSEANDAFMLFNRTMGHKVCTLWQGAVLLVQAFPLFPDMVAVAHTIADDAGEPSAAAIHAAALADQNVMQGPSQGYPYTSSKLDISIKAQHVVSSIPTTSLTPQSIFGIPKGPKPDSSARWLY